MGTGISKRIKYHKNDKNYIAALENDSVRRKYLKEIRQSRSRSSSSRARSSTVYDALNNVFGRKKYSRRKHSYKRKR